MDVALFLLRGKLTFKILTLQNTVTGIRIAEDIGYRCVLNSSSPTACSVFLQRLFPKCVCYFVLQVLSSLSLNYVDFSSLNFDVLPISVPTDSSG